ncbi:hypothetical protein FCV25MIE_14448, partial [Fagus crenata]
TEYRRNFFTAAHNHRCTATTAAKILTGVVLNAALFQLVSVTRHAKREEEFEDFD